MTEHPFSTEEHNKTTGSAKISVMAIIAALLLLFSWGIFWWSVFQIARYGRSMDYFLAGGVAFLASIVFIILQEALRRRDVRKANAYYGVDMDDAPEEGREEYDDGYEEDRDGYGYYDLDEEEYPEEYPSEDAASWNTVSRNAVSDDAHAYRNGKDVRGAGIDRYMEEDACPDEDEDGDQEQFAEEEKGIRRKKSRGRSINKGERSRNDIYEGGEDYEDRGGYENSEGYENRKEYGNSEGYENRKEYGNSEGYEDSEGYENGREHADEPHATVSFPDTAPYTWHRHPLALRILEGVFFAAIAAAGCAGVAWAATPYNGWLSLKIHDATRERKVSYTHDNLYQDGIQGIFTDINTVVELPAVSALYIEGAQTINYDIDGTVTNINLLLKGIGEYGVQETYRITYNASTDSSDKNITVETTVQLNEGEGSGTNTTRTSDSDMILRPFLDLSEAMDLSSESLAYENLSGETSLQLVYWGYRAFPVNDYTYYISQDGTRTYVHASSTARTQTSRTTNTQTQPEQQIEGYEISLHSAGIDTIDPARYFATWKYTNK